MTDFNSRVPLNEDGFHFLSKMNKPIVTLIGSNGEKKSHAIHSLFDLPLKDRHFILTGTSPRISFFSSSSCLLMDIEVPFDTLPVFSSIINIPPQEELPLSSTPPSSKDSTNVTSTTNSFQSPLASQAQPLTAKDLLTRAAKISSLVILPLEEQEISVDTPKSGASSPSTVFFPELLHRSLSEMISAYVEAHSKDSAFSVQPLHIVILVLESQPSHLSEESIKQGIAAIVDAILPSPTHSPLCRLSVLKLSPYNENLKGVKQTLHQIISKQAVSLPGKIEHMVAPPSQRSPLEGISEFHTFSQIREDTLCEDVYSDVLQRAKAFVKQWHHFIDRGERISHFGRLADIAYLHHLDMYDLNTLAAMGSFVRGKIRDRLTADLQEVFRTLFFRQLILLEREGRRSLRSQLLQRTKIGELPDVAAKEAIIRKVLLEMDAGIEDMMTQTSSLAAEIDAVMEAFKRNYKQALKEQAEKFDFTPLAQLQVQGNLETASDVLKSLQGSSDKKSKKQRGIRMGFGLTAMLRQSGYGNLQGFANYDGGPFTLTFGYANDRDSLEAMQDGQKPPIFRIQPKFQFDINV
ncbi:hypothetical protein IE077_002010 [Cardiosporidium cionae]|uniref:GED domain-containing protein n=1 Tax=Cardiosporidium cionae TaxID=476202 RepID=A0ABQ7JBT0_9APIC|nr:hypothetical protein IE077_002010 [Cardiosporidium cionae]|eukprot:KAF8821457.1 hypothetical protein IE077_002010 [Cardiosporidium cionae]